MVDMIDDEAFKLYKPLRNELRNYSIEDVLSVCKAYSQALTYRLRLPSDLEPIPKYNDFGEGIHNWELEIIAREAIINSSEHIHTGKTLKKASNFLRTINKLRKFEDDLAKQYGSQENVLRELQRIAHRQFEYQAQNPSSTLMYRYHKIFSKPALDKIVNEAFGFDTHRLYLIGMLLTGSFINWFALHYPPEIKLPKQHNLTMDEINQFLEHFSKPLDELRELLKADERQINENYAYYFDSLMKFPIVKMEAQGRMSLVSPLPILITWRFTKGVYYELNDKSGFDKAFGNAFEEYVGDALKHIFSDTKFAINPEEPKGKHNLPSSDWYVSDEQSSIFVECKTWRMTLPAKINLHSDDALNEQLEKLSSSVIQAYKAVKAFRDGRHKNPTFKFDSQKQIYPIVVTLESWYLFGKTLKMLTDIVEAKMKDEKLPTEWLNEIPFIVCNISELEKLMQLIHMKDSIKEVLQDKNDDETKHWELYTYLHSKFKDDLSTIKPLFEDEFNNLFPIIDGRAKL